MQQSLDLLQPSEEDTCIDVVRWDESRPYLEVVVKPLAPAIRPGPEARADYTELQMVCFDTPIECLV